MTGEERCRRYRRRILELSQKVTAMHIAPAFSCLEIVDMIYNDLLSGDPGASFIMSKGHGVMAQYVVLEALGILPTEALEAYCKPNGILGAHPDRGTPGIIASTGSLGHGLGMAVGLALAKRLDAVGGVRPVPPPDGRVDGFPTLEVPPEPSFVYCLISDGELQEGSTWEAMMMAANLKLDNLLVFVDNNDWGGLERMSEGFPSFYPLEEKARAFSWWADTCAGHNEDDLAHFATRTQPDCPNMLICETVKGKGVSFMENQGIWHYRSPNPEEYARALKELDAPRQP